jgi:hypothetical protein
VKGVHVYADPKRFILYVQIVDEGGRGQRVVGPLRAQPPTRDATKILVHNRDQPAVRRLVSLPPRHEHSRYIVADARHGTDPGRPILPRAAGR